jgi:hypothetical protein
VEAVPIFLTGLQGGVEIARPSPDSNQLALSLVKSGGVTVYDIRHLPMKPSRKRAGWGAKVVDMAWSADSTNLVTLDHQSQVAVWSVRADAEQKDGIVAKSGDHTFLRLVQSFIFPPLFNMSVKVPSTPTSPPLALSALSSRTPSSRNIASNASVSASFPTPPPFFSFASRARAPCVPPPPLLVSFRCLAVMPRLRLLPLTWPAPPARSSRPLLQPPVLEAKELARLVDTRYPQNYLGSSVSFHPCMTVPHRPRVLPADSTSRCPLA